MRRRTSLRWGRKGPHYAEQPTAVEGGTQHVESCTYLAHGFHVFVLPLQLFKVLAHLRLLIQFGRRHGTRWCSHTASATPGPTLRCTWPVTREFTGHEASLLPVPLSGHRDSTQDKARDRRLPAQPWAALVPQGTSTVQGTRAPTRPREIGRTTVEQSVPGDAWCELDRAKPLHLPHCEQHSKWMHIFCDDWLIGVCFLKIVGLAVCRGAQSIATTLRATCLRNVCRFSGALHQCVQSDPAQSPCMVLTAFAMAS